MMQSSNPLHSNPARSASGITYDSAETGKPIQLSPYYQITADRSDAALLLEPHREISCHGTQEA
jgi:hypothetical protein